MEERLRPLTERECYDRLYGERNPLVTVIPASTGPPAWPDVSAERLHRTLLEQFDLQELEAGVEEAA